MDVAAEDTGEQRGGDAVEDLAAKVALGEGGDGLVFERGGALQLLRAGELAAEGLTGGGGEEG